MSEESVQQHLDDLCDVDVISRFPTTKQATCDVVSDVFGSLKFESKSCEGLQQEYMHNNNT